MPWATEQAAPPSITPQVYKNNEDEKYREQFLTQDRWRRVRANPYDQHDPIVVPVVRDDRQWNRVMRRRWPTMEPSVDTLTLTGRPVKPESKTIIRVGSDLYVHASSMISRRTTRSLVNGDSFAVFEAGGD